MSKDRDDRYVTNLELSLDRDFFAEGFDAALAGNSDIPPPSVQLCGPDAESEWLDGYNEFFEVQAEETFET